MCLLATTSAAFGQSASVSPAGPAFVAASPAPQQAGETRPSGSGDFPDSPQPADPPDNRVLTLPMHLLHDQIGLWTSPSHAKLSDATWVVPAGGFAAALFATDGDISKHLSNTPNTLLRY